MLTYRGVLKRTKPIRFSLVVRKVLTGKEKKIEPYPFTQTSHHPSKKDFF